MNVKCKIILSRVSYIYSNRTAGTRNKKNEIRDKLNPPRHDTIHSVCVYIANSKEKKNSFISMLLYSSFLCVTKMGVMSSFSVSKIYYDMGTGVFVSA